MKDRAPLRAALEHPNVRAFLRAIRGGESSQDDSAYWLENGGRLFDGPQAEHPSKGLKSPPGRAFGAYQFLASTWAGLCREYGFEDMGRQCQDEGAVALIVGCRALDEVMAGELEAAFELLHGTWTSLPGGSEPNKLTARAARTFIEWGGQVAAPSEAAQLVASVPVAPETDPGRLQADTGPAPAFNPDSLATEHYGEAITESTITPIPSADQQETHMAPIVLPLLQVAAQFLPQLAEKFGSGSEVSNRNIAAGKVLADAIVTATNSPNLQAAVEKMQGDPEAVKAAKAAVSQAWPDLFEVAGGITEARKMLPTDGPWWHQFASIPFTVIVMLMPIVYFVIYQVITGSNWTQEIRASVVSAVISGVLFAIVGFALGTSYGSQRKTNLLANKE